MRTVPNQETIEMANILVETGDVFPGENPRHIADLLSDYIRSDQDGWRSDFAPHVDLDQVDFGVLGVLVTD